MSTDDQKSTTTIIEELLIPDLSLSDIICDDNDDKNNDNYVNIGHYYPSRIIDDWLYLGSMHEANDLKILKELGITHILNVTDTIPNFYPNNFKYAKIHLDDTGAKQIYKYFEATKQFINQCNPLINDNNNKIFIHCAVGMSRSASIVIAYLISMKVELNNMDQNRLNYVEKKLNDKQCKHEFSVDMQTFMSSWPAFKYIDYENNLNDKQLNELKEYRLEFRKNNKYKGIELNLAYYYVKSCRSLISPNIGFCSQLHRYSKLYHDGDNLYDLEKFTALDNKEYIVSIWEEASEKYPNAINKKKKASFCVIL